MTTKQAPTPRAPKQPYRIRIILLTVFLFFVFVALFGLFGLPPGALLMVLLFAGASGLAKLIFDAYDGHKTKRAYDKLFKNHQDTFGALGPSAINGTHLDAIDPELHSQSKTITCKSCGKTQALTPSNSCKYCRAKL